MRKFLSVLVAFILVFGVLAGCGSTAAKYKDGTFVGQSKADERGNYGKITVTIKEGKITAADYKGYLKDGSMKDENYGKTAGDDKYKQAQDALKATANYGPKLVETQDVEKVDTISGATDSHGQFKEAVKDALSKAK